MDPKQKAGDLLEERAKLVTEQRDILDKAESEKRDLTAEDRQSYDQRGEKIGELEADIRRYEAAASAPEFGGSRKAPSPDAAEEEEREGALDAEVRERIGSDEYRDAFEAYTRGHDLSDEQRSTLNVGADAQGGFAVAESWTTLHEKLREAGTIRELAEVITTETGGAFHVPVEDTDATAPALVAEEAPFPDDADEISEVVFGAYKYGRTTKASEEVVQDAIFDVPGYVGKRLGFQLGRVTNNKFVNGNGTTEPQGLFAGAVVADTLTSLSAIAPDEVIDLAYSVIAPYRKNGVYIANDTTIGAIRKIKDLNGQYMWQPGLTAGDPDRLNGFPIHADPDVSPLAASKRVLGFGDVKSAYLIRDVLGVVIKFLDQTYAGNDQVAWRGKLRTDGRIIDPAAFKVAATPAS